MASDVRLFTYLGDAYEYLSSITKPPFGSGRTGLCRTNDHIDRKRRKDRARKLTLQRMEELNEH